MEYRYLTCPNCGLSDGNDDKILDRIEMGDIEDDDPWDDYDWCYECTGYGDDYSYDEDGELVSNCDNCPNNPNRYDDWDE